MKIHKNRNSGNKQHKAKHAHKNKPHKQQRKPIVTRSIPKVSIPTTTITTTPSQQIINSQQNLPMVTITPSPQQGQNRSMSMTKTRQPLSYRHLYHAGNHADVMKHAIFVQLAAQQLRKIPFGRLFIDTHAGPGGTYDLQHEYARKTQEYTRGVGRLYDIARISALNPHITAETTLRRGIDKNDPAYTHDPLYMRLQAPASDLFENLPLQNGYTAPGSQTRSIEHNQNRGELIVPVMTIPHPLLHAANHAVVLNPEFADRVKDSYYRKAGVDVEGRTQHNAVQKLQRFLNKIKTQLNTIQGQQALVTQLKKEFALLRIQEATKAAKEEAEYQEYIKNNPQVLEEEEEEEQNDNKLQGDGDDDDDDDDGSIVDPSIKYKKVEFTDLTESDEFDVKEFLEEEGITPSESFELEDSIDDDGNSLDDISGTTDEIYTEDISSEDVNTEQQSSSNEEGNKKNKKVQYKQETIDDALTDDDDNNNGEEKQKQLDTSTTTTIRNDTRNEFVGKFNKSRNGDDTRHFNNNKKPRYNNNNDNNSRHHHRRRDDNNNENEDVNPEALATQEGVEDDDDDLDDEVNATLVNSPKAFLGERGPIPEVGPAKEHLYKTKSGERTTFRRLGKPEIKVDQETGKVEIIDPIKAQLIKQKDINNNKKFKTPEQRQIEDLTAVGYGGLQEDPIAARQRAINVLTKRIAFEEDFVEDAITTIDRLNSDLKIPSKHNNMIKFHSNKLVQQHQNNLLSGSYLNNNNNGNQELNDKLTILRTNQKDTAQLFTYLRHLLPIPHSMLPYFALLHAANKPPTLNSIIQKPNYADLLVGDAITKEKAKALEERQKRDLMSDGTFQQSVKLSKDEKLKLLKSIINGSVIDAYLHNIDDTYHTQQKLNFKVLRKDDEIYINNMKQKYQEWKEKQKQFKNNNNNRRGGNNDRRNHRDRRNQYEDNNNNTDDNDDDNNNDDLKHLNLDPDALFIQQHKPHESLYNPHTDRQYVPLTMHANEWLTPANRTALTNENADSLLNPSQIASAGGILEDEEQVYPLLNRPQAKDILFAPSPSKKKELDRRMREHKKGTHLNEHHLRDPTGGRGRPYNSSDRTERRDSRGNDYGDRQFGNNNNKNNRRYDDEKLGRDDIDALYGLDMLPEEHRRGGKNQWKNQKKEYNNDDRNFSRDNNNNNNMSKLKNRQKGFDNVEKNVVIKQVETAGLGNISFSTSSVFDDMKERERQERQDREFSKQTGIPTNNTNNQRDDSYGFNRERRSNSNNNKGPSLRELKQRQMRQNNGDDYNNNNGYDNNKRNNRRQFSTLLFNKPTTNTTTTNTTLQPGSSSLMLTNNNNNKTSAATPSTATRRSIITSKTSSSIKSLPPTLQMLLPMARLGVVNPDLITNILKQNFTTTTTNQSENNTNDNEDNTKQVEQKSVDIWSTLLKQSKQKKDLSKTHNKLQKAKINNEGDNDNDNDDNHLPTFNNKKLKTKNINNKDNNNDSQSYSNQFEQQQQQPPRGDSRRSRDAARKKQQHAEIWSRQPPSTEIQGIDHSFDNNQNLPKTFEGDRPEMSKIHNLNQLSSLNNQNNNNNNTTIVKDTLQELNNAFVDYSIDVPIISKASIKSLYTTTDSPIQTLLDTYETYRRASLTSRERSKLKKKNNKGHKQQQQQQEEEKTLSQELAEEEEIQLSSYVRQKDDAVGVILGVEQESIDKFNALTILQKQYDESSKALNYLHRSLTLYTNDDKLFHTTLNQPLYNSPSSPWIMDNLIRNNFYSPIKNNSTDENNNDLTNEDVIKALHGHFDGDNENDNDNVSPSSITNNNYINPDKHKYLPMIKDILVLNELHSTEYQTLRKNQDETIMNEFYHEALLQQRQALFDENPMNDIITPATRGLTLSSTSEDNNDNSHYHQKQQQQQAQEQEKINNNEEEEQRLYAKGQRKLPKVPHTAYTLGDAISRIAATSAVESTQLHDKALQLFGTKYINFNHLQTPLTTETHGAHNIFIDDKTTKDDLLSSSSTSLPTTTAQRFAFQYNGFQSAQIFLKQYQYYCDFISRMSYSAMNPTSPNVQRLNQLHDEQYDVYEQMHYKKYNNNNNFKQQQQNQISIPNKKDKNTNFISTSLTLCDPAYETGEEYVNALDLLRTTLDFNSRGNAHTLAIWYPVLDKINPDLPDDYENTSLLSQKQKNKQKKKLLNGEEQEDNDVYNGDDDDDTYISNNTNNNYDNDKPFDMSKVTRRDINRGHFFTTLLQQFNNTPKHKHHTLFLSISSYLVQQYRTTISQPYQTGKPYALQQPTGHLDTVVAETYVGLPSNLPTQRKNIYMTGSGMLITSPLLPQELDQSLNTMLPWISTALNNNAMDNIYNHVVTTKKQVNNNNNNDDETTISTSSLPPLADFTLTWM